MFVISSSRWHNSHTDLSKYFLERISQKVDSEEIISNRHRTSNGYTLIREIIDVAMLARKRIKSVKRLMSLVNEAKSELLSSSIVNDYILKKYFPDIVDYYSKINVNKLSDNSKDLSELLTKSKINAIRLEKEYVLNIILELNLINWETDSFYRTSITIDKIVDCLIPYSLYQGYSATSLYNIAYRLAKKANGKTAPRRYISSFDGKPKDYIFLIKFKTGCDEINEIFSYLRSRGTNYYEVEYQDLIDNLHEDFVVEDGESLFLIEHKTIDPHNYLRNIYEIGLKNYVTSKDRLSLEFFTTFFDGVYWRFNVRTHKFLKSNMPIDPINVPKRKSTLRTTLSTVCSPQGIPFDENTPIPIVHEIRDCLYYYNLALGSKSIENSLSLLWTCLETLLPYRIKENDIENVQYFVSKSLSIGVIGRQIASFGIRLAQTHSVNNNCFNVLNFHNFYVTPEEIKKLIVWLGVDFSTADDPFNLLKNNSELLCKIFINLNDIFTGKDSNHKTVEYWLQRLKKSETAISFQLDRIYLHRNQIVHSGKFINEYSNLWNHLEWYVGKLLSYCVLSYLKLDDKSDFNKETLFLELEADYNQLVNLLENNKTKKINEINFTYTLIAKHSWQFT